MKHSRWFRLLAMTGIVFLICSGSALASPTLKMNSHGHDVLLLQQKLKNIGYSITSVDGVFGKETERAVAEFQRDQKISITGIVNHATWRALKKAEPLKTNLKTDTGTNTKNNKKDKNKKNKSKKEANKKESSFEFSVPSITDTAPFKVGKPVPFHKQILEANKVTSLISTAKQYIGVPYQFGGTTPKGFDCSGYLQYIFAKEGLNIPRLADDQYRLGVSVKSSKQLVPGDLVFFSTSGSGISHSALYLGDEKFIHASSSKGIRIDELSSSYWKPRFVGGKHIVR